MHDQFDVTLEDADLLGEVELTTNLIIAASESDDHLSSAEIDRILGVTRATASLRHAQQVANSTGPLERSDRTYSPSRVRAPSSPRRPRHSPSPAGSGPSKSPPWPGAGPDASAARESALVRAWSSLSNDIATRTSSPGWTRHREAGQRVDLSRGRDELLGLVLVRGVGRAHRQRATGERPVVDGGGQRLAHRLDDARRAPRPSRRRRSTVSIVWATYPSVSEPTTNRWSASTARNWSSGVSVPIDGSRSMPPIHTPLSSSGRW